MAVTFCEKIPEKETRPKSSLVGERENLRPEAKILA